MRITAFCLTAIFATSALVLANASAKAKVLVLKTAKGPLAKGAEVKASSSNLIFVTSAGNLECTSNVLTSVLETNEAKKDKAKVTEEQSTGQEEGGACKTSGGLGRDLIVAGDLPWPTEFTTTGQDTIKGTGKVQFASTFPAAGDMKCIFESAKVASTFKVPGLAELTTSKQLFKLEAKKSSKACPKTGRLSGTFAVTSAGEAVESELR
ncbi:MAG: hypothetical protein ABSG95_02255 [Solirubrobacteraceae bacterium]|jgi:hypothetical protein